MLFFSRFRWSIVTGLVSISMLAAPQMTLASAYEWLTDYGITTTDGSSSCCTTGLIDTLKWWIHTSSNFYEYRTVYVATSTDGTMPTVPSGCAPATPGNCGAWQELSECEHEGYVNGVLSDSDHCSVNHTAHPDSWFRAGGISSRLWVRVTDQYAGCGGYTLTPNVASCGDLVEANYPLH